MISNCAISYSGMNKLFDPLCNILWIKLIYFLNSELKFESVLMLLPYMKALIKNFFF